MLKSSTKTDINTTELVINIDAVTFETAVENEYRRQRNNIQIKGFRKGKVSRKICEKIFGENIFYEGAINSLIDSEIHTVITESKLSLVDKPNINVTSVDKENGVELKVICITKPEINISNYIGIKATKIVKNVTDDDINNQINMIRKKNARIVSVYERAAQIGDNVIIDFVGYLGDEILKNGTAQDYSLVLGSGQLISGFEDQIVGHNIGEEFNIVVTLPENYPKTDYAGKEAVFKTKLKAISYEELPEIDDELIKDSTEFATIDEYKAYVKMTLEESSIKQADSEFSNAIFDAVISKVKGSIPKCMYEHRIDDLMNIFKNQLKQQGMNLNIYCQYTGTDENSIRDTYRDQAENEVKLRLALEKIAEIENIEVSDEEINETLEKFAKSNSMDDAVVRKFISMNEFKTNIKIQKAADFVKDNAVIYK